MDLASAPLARILTRAMAQTLGVSLTRAAIDGWYFRAEFDHLVEACAACNQTPNCSKWLAMTTKAHALPSYCVNKSEIEALSF